MDSIQELEEFLSLQDLKTLRSFFMNAVRVKQENMFDGLDVFQQHKKELAGTIFF